jgi:hypothetical protein
MNGRDQLEMLLHPLRMRPPYSSYIRDNNLPIRNIFEATTDSRFHESPSLAIDFNKSILYYSVLHCHEDYCDTYGVDFLIKQGASVSPPGSRMTPLQLAVHRWDCHGTTQLLKAGADANEVGDPNGEILPYTDITLSACSPLHILRTGSYGLQYIEEHANLKEWRRERRAEIEALLLEFGALDFVRDEPV